MPALNLNPNVLKKIQKMRRRNPKTGAHIEKTLSLLRHDPFARPLKTHKVIARYDSRSAFSSKVMKDIRIIWRPGKDGDAGYQILNLIDIGGHSGGRKVYK